MFEFHTNVNTSTMIIPILFVSIAIFLINIILIFIRPHHEKYEVKNICFSEEELIRRVVEKMKNEHPDSLSKKLRSGVFYSSIKKAQKCISHKMDEKRSISEGEKWLYENHRIIYKNIFSMRYDFNGLPSYKNVPRIIILMREIVSGSLGVLTPERMKRVIDSLKDMINLSYEEAIHLPDAFRYTLLEQIYVLSKRIIYNEHCYRLSLSKHISKKMILSNSYLYQWIQNNGINDFLKRKGIEEGRVKLLYMDTLMNNAKSAQTYINALSKMSDYLSYKSVFGMMGSYSLLSRIPDFDNLSFDTIKSYSNKISFVAKRCKVSEEYVSEILLQCSNINKVDISLILFDYLYSFIRTVRKGDATSLNLVNNNWLDRLYVGLVLVLSLASSICLGIFISPIFAFFSFVPILFCIDKIVLRLLSCKKNKYECLKMNFDCVGADNATSVVYSIFCSSISELNGCIEEAKSMLSINRDKYINAILLVDTPPSDTAISELDKEIVSFFNSNQTDGIYLFLRKKTFNGKRFSAKERKRGAFLSLCRFFEENDDSHFYYISDKNINKPKFFVTLDTDNFVYPGGILDLVNRIIHPYNKKYTIISTVNRVDLFSLTTLYSKRYRMEAGFEKYPFGVGGLYSLFGKDLYCGKGIIRVKEFYNSLKGLFPPNKILSHDIPEGAIVSCCSGGMTFESAPSSFLSDVIRKRRWMRGDLQNICFVLGRWRNEFGEKIHQKLSILYRYILLKNILVILQPLCFVVLFLLGVFYQKTGLFLGLGLFLYPLLLDIYSTIKLLNKKSSKYIFEQFFHIFRYYTEEFFMLVYNAFNNLWLICRTYWRMIFKKNLLEWKVFSTSSNNSLANYCKEFSIATAISVIVSVIGLFARINIPIYYLYGYALCSIICFLCLFLSSKKYHQEDLTSKDREKLLDYARCTYNYFSYIKNEGLSADNLQIKPYKGLAKYTSPTDLGFCLLSDICAVKMNFISESQCLESIKDQLKKINKLPKWNGILYNWYSVDTLIQTNDFVSSVDEGNILISLLLVRQYYVNIDKTIVAMVDKIISETDLNRLYDEDKELFYVGYSGQYTGHYDMLCSESRILSFVYTMCSGNGKHYLSIPRDYTSQYGNFLLSWGGTAFEALLPELFFKTPEESLLSLTAEKNVLFQIKNKIKGIWGVSESGYRQFDDEMVYQYRTFGLKELSVSTDTKNDVITPYASALCLCFSPITVLENLKKLEEKGMLGEYGFYESIDYMKGEKKVFQYMSHHQGMILCSICNFLYPSFFTNLLDGIPSYRGLRAVVNELPSSDRITPFKKEKIQRKREKISDTTTVIYDAATEMFTACLTDGNMSLFCNANGSSFMKYDDIYIQKKMPEYTDCCGGFFYVHKDEKIVSPAFLPICDDKNKYVFTYNGKEIIYTNTIDDLSQSVTLIHGLGGMVYKLNCLSKSIISFYSDICLNKIDAFYAHPTFSDMFVSSEKIDNSTVIFYSKKSKLYLCAHVIGCSALNVNTNRYNFIGRGKTLFNPSYVGDNAKFGDILAPCFSFNGVVKEDECQVVFLTGYDKKELLINMSLLPLDVYQFALQCNNPYPLLQKTTNMISSVLYGRYNYEFLVSNIIPDRKIVVCECKSPKEIDDYIRLYEEFKSIGFKIILLFTSQKYKSSIEVECGKRGIRYYFSESRPCYNSQCDIRLYYLDRFDESRWEIEKPPITYLSGAGGFNELGEYVFYSDEQTGRPYSHIISGKNGGSVVTTSGGGFFWFGNSRENKTCRFDNDPVSDPPKEFLRFTCSDGTFNLLGGVSKGRYITLSSGKYTSVVNVNNTIIKTEITAVCDGSVRVLSIEVNNYSDKPYTVEYCMYPCLKDISEPEKIYYEELQKNLLCVCNAANGRKVYLRFLSNGINGKVDHSFPLPNLYFGSEKSCLNYILFSDDLELIKTIEIDSIKEMICNFTNEFERQITIESVGDKNKGLKNIFNALYYQVLVSRMYARCGYYQVGGAIGFRDQLQDAMALSERPDVLKKQILLCCAHQYEEGDVMHWWHPEKFGLRTRITDDKLFLPWAVCRYINVSMDTEILNIDVDFLHSEQLRPGENDRFENPAYGKKGTVLDHCLSAIRSSLKYGEHRLLIMGAGDWNDGMDEICRKGVGESVFNSMLAVMVLRDFSRFCSPKIKKQLLSIADELKQNINKYAFDGDRYIRLFSDDGYALGKKGSEVLELDILVQSFAVLSGICEEEVSNIILDTCRQLIDKEVGIIKLLAPPQSNKFRLGYISDYPEGIRENGGQYTHAAIWYLIALCKIGRQDEAYEYFCMINPAQKCSTKVGNDIYGGEPYVLSGDVYSNADNYGKCGWSWYTGSAGWAYRLLYEEFFGIKKSGDKLYIEPHLPKKLIGTVIKYKYKSSIILIEYKKGNEDKLILDGVESDFIKLNDRKNIYVIKYICI